MAFFPAGCVCGEDCNGHASNLGLWRGLDVSGELIPRGFWRFPHKLSAVVFRFETNPARFHNSDKLCYGPFIYNQAQGGGVC